MFEVRGSSLECQAAMAQEWPRGATLCPRSVAAGRSNPGAVAAEAQEGLEELSHVEGQEPQR